MHFLLAISNDNVSASCTFHNVVPCRIDLRGGGDAAVATVTVATCFSECQVVHLQRSNGATGARRYRLACRGFRARPVAINYKRPLKATLSQLLVGQAFAASRCDVAASII